MTLTQADLDMIKSTLMTRIHNHDAGTRAAWNNPQSGNSGTIALLSVVPRGAQRCEQIEYHNIPPHGAPSDRFVLTSCIQPDGSWRLS